MRLHRARRLRLLLRDGSAAIAFCAMAISGVLPGWVCLLFALGLLVAFVGFRPLSGRPQLAAWILVAAALGIGFLAWRGMDVVVAACSFSALLTVDRMLVESSPTSDRQVLLTGLLMATGACALSGDLLFGATLVAYVPLGCAALALGVVEPPTDEEVPVGGVLRAALFGAVGTLVGGCLLFAVMPRLPWHFAVRPRGSLGKPVTGFADAVTLGGDGTLQRDGRTVIRVKLRPDPEIEKLEAYWVGATFERFDGHAWHGRKKPVAFGKEIHLGPVDGPPIRQRFELLPAYGARTLIALETPVIFARGVARRPSGGRPVSLVRLADGEVRFHHRARSYRYVAFSLKRTHETLDPGEKASALALPKTLDPRIPPLAKKAGGSGSAKAIARNLTKWLRTGFRYTLELQGHVAHPLSDFLFHRKAGHCEHFATALAILLRARGIPARVAAGFYGGTRVGDAYILRAGDAHAWTQAWIDGHWERFDATPPEDRGAEPPLLLDRFESLYEQLSALWRTHVLSFSANTQAHAWHSLIARTSGGASPSAMRWPLGIALLISGCLLVAWAARRRPAHRPPRHVREAQALLEGAERLLAGRPSARVGRSDENPSGWLEERAARMRAAGDPAALAATHLTRRYLEARFGASGLDQSERRALLRTLRSALDVPFAPSGGDRPTGASGHD